MKRNGKETESPGISTHHSAKTTFASKDLNINMQECNSIISVDIPTGMKLFGNATNEEKIEMYYINILKKFLTEFH